MILWVTLIQTLREQIEATICTVYALKFFRHDAVEPFVSRGAS